MTLKANIVHNFYRSSRPSGENAVVLREVNLLKANNVTFSTLKRQSDELLMASLWTKICIMFNLPGSNARKIKLETKLKQSECNLVHLHNPWPLLTYDIARASLDLGLPFIQTLHNYRLLATDYCFAGEHGLRKSQNANERDNLKRMPALHGSFIRNWAYGRALKRIWAEGIPQKLNYICLTKFQQRLVTDAGIPMERTVVKPNFLDHKGPVGKGPGEFALFVGRLSSEKGVRGLAEAWPATGLPLKVIGGGPDARFLHDKPNIECLGPLAHEQVQGLMAQARFLLMNSTWYEGFPLVLIEALAAGTPCLVPRLGGMPAIIPNGVLGRTFAPEDGVDLVEQAKRLWEDAPTMREACRAEFEAKYTPERNLKMLLEIYDNLMLGKPPSDGLDA